MPDKFSPDPYYSMKEIDKRISKMFKPPTLIPSLRERFKGLRLRLPKLPLLGRRLPRIK